MIPQNIKDKLLKFDEVRFATEGIEEMKLGVAVDSAYIRAGRTQHSELLPAIENLIKIVKIQGEALDTALNYLYWREDDLVGDDLIGDQKLTSSYKARVKVLEKARSQVAELLKELEGEKDA